VGVGGINVCKSSYRNLVCWIGTKVGGGKWGQVGGGSIVGASVFVVLICVWVYFCCRTRGCFCQGLKGLGLFKICIIGWSAGDECVGREGSLVIGWERMGGR
jgi:hypothetical protein